jgi:hypothetical protein
VYGGQVLHAAQSGTLLADNLSKRLNARVKWFINEQSKWPGLYETGAKRGLLRHNYGKSF